MDYENKAVDLFYEGYNCAQSVFGGFIDILPFDFEEGMALTAAFGGGIAARGEICGALSGALMVISTLSAKVPFQDKTEKTNFYQEMALFINKFEAESGSILCVDLLESLERKPLKMRQVNGKRCEEYVRRASRLVIDYLGLK